MRDWSGRKGVKEVSERKGRKGMETWFDDNEVGFDIDEMCGHDREGGNNMVSIDAR